MFWKAAGLILITMILYLAMGKTDKDFSILLTICACVIVATVAIFYLEPIIGFLWDISSMGEFENETMKLLLKAVGIALVAELSVWICNDAGIGSLGKVLQLLGSVSILYLSVPIFQSLLTLIREILGEV